MFEFYKQFAADFFLSWLAAKIGFFVRNFAHLKKVERVNLLARLGTFSAQGLVCTQKVFFILV